MSSSVTIVDPSQQAMSERISAALRTKQAGYMQANENCDSSGKSYLKWSMMFLLITNIVFFTYLVSDKSTRDFLDWIGYPWTILFVLWSGFYVIPNISSYFSSTSKPVQA